jgi:toxin-antitoxin system PIN domain toxin
VLVDANLLIYAVDRSSAQHRQAHRWWQETLNSGRRVGLPWQSVHAFLRILTHPRAMRSPLPASDAWTYVQDWLAWETVWTPVPGTHYGEIFGGLLVKGRLTGNLVPDAALGALALEHGLVVQTTDADFARIPGVSWRNPLDD